MSEIYSFYTATLGCKINQYETQALREVWLKRGFTEVESAEEATLVLVNSCAVTAKAVSDVRSTVRQANRANPEAKIVVTGCAAQVMREELATLPGVAHVVPQEAKASLKKWPELPEGYVEPDEAHFPDFAVSNYNRARAVVKVQDGCSHRCTYCIVPLARGRSRSRSIADVVAEVATLMESGFREIILSGVNLRQFGRDLEAVPAPAHGDDKASEAHPDFWDLLSAIEHALAPAWAGKARLRISSLEPGQLGEKALATLAASKLVCPQLHLSLQSGSDSVLKRMGRGHYKAAPLLDFLDQLRTIWPVYGLGADILMGFPGETEDEFIETLEYVKLLPLTYAHVFPYSIRPGTAAAGMPKQLEKAVKKERAKAIRDVVAGKKEAFLQQLIESGAELQIVLQSAEKRTGISQYYTECVFDALPLGATVRNIYAGKAYAQQKGNLRLKAQ